MWTYDKYIQMIRGFMQGWHQGFYKNSRFEINIDCFSKTSVEQIYWVWFLINNFDLDGATKLVGLFFNLYFMVDHSCYIEQNLYDLATFCFNNNCEPE